MSSFNKIDKFIELSTQNKNEKTVYLPGLNGLRAIAALSVLIAHVMMPGIADFSLKPLFRLPLAEFGVTLFFVISGFLITYLLLLEENKSPINVRNFYIRRILRIWPLYYGYIFVYLVLWLCSNNKNIIFPSTIYWYIFFAANVPFVLDKGILLMVHYWSIGVEEQFYLLWPWFVKFAKDKLLTYSLILLLIWFSSKLLFWYFSDEHSIIYRSLSITRFHCMIVGAIGSILYYQDHYINLVSKKIVQLLAWIVLVAIGFGLIHIPAPIAHEFFSLLSLVLIIGQIKVRNRIVNLELSAFNFIGKISYGIYVIHPIIIFLLSPLIKELVINDSMKYLIAYSSVLFITIGLAYLSYEFFEKPFLKYKGKFSIIKSTNVQFGNTSR